MTPPAKNEEDLSQPGNSSFHMSQDHFGTNLSPQQPQTAPVTWFVPARLERVRFVRETRSQNPKPLIIVR